MQFLPSIKLKKIKDWVTGRGRWGLSSRDGRKLDTGAGGQRVGVPSTVLFTLRMLEIFHNKNYFKLSSERLFCARHRAHGHGTIEQAAEDRERHMQHGL